MIDDKTQAVINDVLAEMQAIWNRSHRWVTRDDFENLKQIHDNYPDKKLADNLWSRNGLPKDFVFHEHKFPMTMDLMGYLNNADPIDYHFSLSAQDIIDKQISPQVAACSGHAKLFAHLATKRGLDCRIIMTADLHGYAAQPDKHLINGHQIIAVRGINGGLVAFDPQFYPLRLLADHTEIKVGKFLQSVEGAPKYKITAILTPDEFSNVRTYNATENLYLHITDIAGKFHKGMTVARSRADTHALVEQILQSKYENE